MDSKIQHLSRIFQRRANDKLEPRTAELIDRLFAAQWFTSVGQPLPATVHAVRSWMEAVDFAKDPDEVFHEARSDYIRRLRHAAPQCHDEWNAIVILVKSAIEDRIDAKLEPLLTLLEPQAHKEVRDQIRWSVLHACMESEYLDIVPVGFFLPLMDRFIAGRFPCGWFGKYPQGMLAVY